MSFCAEQFSLSSGISYFTEMKRAIKATLKVGFRISEPCFADTVRQNLL